LPGSNNVRDLLDQLGQVEQSRDFMARQKIHLVVVPESGAPICTEPDTVRDLVARLTELQGQNVNVFVFLGERWHISRPPYRHLLPPGQTPIPLYMPPGEMIDVDPDGDMASKPGAVALPGDAGTRPGLGV
jgi:hypothetical protein